MEKKASPSALVGLAIGSLGGGLLAYHLGRDGGFSDSDRELTTGLVIGSVLGFLVVADVVRSTGDAKF